MIPHPAYAAPGGGDTVQSLYRSVPPELRRASLRRPSTIPNPNLYSSHFSAQVSLAVLALMNSRSASLAQRCRCPGHASQLLGRVSPPRLVQDWLVEQAGVEPLVPHETDT